MGTSALGLSSNEDTDQHQQSGQSVDKATSCEAQIGPDETYSGSLLGDQMQQPARSSQIILSGVEEESICENIEVIDVVASVEENEFWDKDKLVEKIEWLNSDAEIRELIKVFREERREIIGDSRVDLITYHNCCQILIDEIDDLIKMKLSSEWTPYNKALQFYNECLTPADFERLP